MPKKSQPKNRPLALEKAVLSYGELRPTYERFTAKLHFLLEDLLHADDISVHVIEARAKSLESFSEKISRVGKSYSDPMQEITDLSGLRVILYYQDDIDRVAGLLEREFLIDQERSIDKRAILGPDQFGYLSVHKVVALSAARANLDVSEIPQLLTLTSRKFHNYQEREETRSIRKTRSIGVVDKGVSCRILRISDN